MGKLVDLRIAKARRDIERNEPVELAMQRIEAKDDQPADERHSLTGYLAVTRAIYDTPRKK